LNICNNIAKFNADWKTLSERDAVKRLREFLSKKEIETIKTQLRDKHANAWKASNQNFQKFFDSTGLDKIVRIIQSVDASKYPRDFDPAKHTVDAVRRSLFTYTALCSAHEGKISALESQVADLTAKQTQNKSTISELKGKLGKRRTGQDPPKPTQHTKDYGSYKLNKLMRPNSKGMTPCIKCAKQGVRAFHDPKFCDPVKRAKAASLAQSQDNTGNQNDDENETFPPPDHKRQHPRDAYKSGSCPQCIKEDVDPTFAASHDLAHCFRVKGGYCDEVGAKTRSERRQAVREKVKMMRTESQKARGGRKKGKSTRGKGAKFSKSTQLSVRAPVDTEAPQATASTATEGGAVSHTPKRRGNHSHPPLAGANATPLGTRTTAKPSSSALAGANTTPLGERTVDKPSNQAPASASATLSSKRTSDPSNQDRKIRSRVYAKSEYALQQPLTDAELKFAMAENADYINKGHLRHQFESKGKEHNLKQLRKRITLAALKANASSQSGARNSRSQESDESSYESDSYLSESSYTSGYSRSRSRKRSRP